MQMFCHPPPPPPLQPPHQTDRNKGISTDKQNAWRYECTFKIEIVREIGVAVVIIYLKKTVLAISDVLARLAQSVRPWRIVIDFNKLVGRSRVRTPSNDFFFFLTILFARNNRVFLFSLTSLSRLFYSYRDEPIGRWGETGVPRETT